MSDRHIALHAALIDLECELRNLNLWQGEAPTAEALASTQPFCIDTLSFPQWLQFVFLERMLLLAENKAALPEKCGIAPMAEEYFKPMTIAAAELINALAEIDRIISHA